MPSQRFAAELSSIEVDQRPLAADARPCDATIDIAVAHLSEEPAPPSLVALFLFCDQKLVKPSIKSSLSPLKPTLHELVQLEYAVDCDAGKPENFKEHVAIVVARVVLRIELRRGLGPSRVFLLYFLIAKLLLLLGAHGALRALVHACCKKTRRTQTKPGRNAK